MTLARQQQALRRAIVGDAPDTADALLRDGAPLLPVYRHAYRARLAAALRDNHDTLARAMGDEAFDTLASAYVDACPSRTPSIRWFGAGLADFMAAHEPLVPHPAFIDLARMDWALRGAFDAPDAPLLSAQDLSALAPDGWPELVLRLHPSVRLLQLEWAIGPAWKALQAEEEADLPEPQRAPHLLVVWRPVLETRWRSAQSALEARLLQALPQGQTFAALCESAAQAVGDDAAAASVVGLLQQWLAEGLLAASA
jgi:hypothetical protein